MTKQSEPINIRPSICIVGFNAYGAVTGENNKHAGGIERQVALMSEWFAEHDYDISVITWDEGYNDGAILNNVKLYKTCSISSGYKFIRFFYPRWTSFNKALSNANSDIYLYSCGDLALGQLALWSRKNNKKVIYLVANESDCTKELSPHLKPIRERVLYKYGLKRADKIITQTNKQSRLLKENYNLDSLVIRMPSKGFQVTTKFLDATLCKQSKRVLWVGRFSEEKRLEWLLDIAEKMPEIEFDIIGDANIKTEYSIGLFERAQNIKNATLHGRVRYEQLGYFYSNAWILCSTSVYEGFPNVFLEAWSAGVPLVTFFDPDDVVKKYGMGSVASSKEDYIKIFRRYVDDDELWNKASRSALLYFEKFHTIDNVMPKLENEIINLANDD